jgi:N-acetylglutamate synthase-like GNAT family acetyltransferase
MKISEVTWDDVKHIPENFDKGGASFYSHKQKEVWFSVVNDGNILCVSKTLYVSKSIARICSIWTHPAVRGKGLASIMIKHQIKNAKENSFSAIQAISKENVFKRNGFSETKDYKEGSSLWELKI